MTPNGLAGDLRFLTVAGGCRSLVDLISDEYREDRLLQENGYFVLRFLAEDMGKELDASQAAC